MPTMSVGRQIVPDERPPWPHCEPALTLSDASLHRTGDAAEGGADEDERELVLFEDGVEHALKLGR